MYAMPQLPYCLVFFHILFFSLRIDIAKISKVCTLIAVNFDFITALKATLEKPLKGLNAKNTLLVSASPFKIESKKYFVCDG